MQALQCGLNTIHHVHIIKAISSFQDMVPNIKGGGQKHNFFIIQHFTENEGIRWYYDHYYYRMGESVNIFSIYL